MISSEAQNSTALGKSSRILKNWQKVRIAMKKLSRNQLILDTKNPEQSSSSKCKLKMIQKIQQQLTCQQYKHFLESLSSLSDKGYTLAPLTLIQNSQIIETTNIIQTKGLSKNKQRMQIKTFKPIPKINYLARQETGKGTVDATGAWVWQAEEVLAYFLMIQFESYRANKVFEIGAGCSGLASLVYAKVWHTQMQMAKIKTMDDAKNQQEVAEQVKNKLELQCLITDGKSDNIILLRKNIDEFYNNLIQQQESSIKIRGQTYFWGNQLAIDNFQSNQVDTNCSFVQFDLILAADCLFFQQYHTSIIRTLQLHLREDTGIALFVNPSRGNSFANFMKSLHQENAKKQNKFIYTTRTINFTDPRYTSSIQSIKQQPSYNKDTDQLIFFEVQKKKKVQKYEYEC